MNQTALPIWRGCLVIICPKDYTDLTDLFGSFLAIWDKKSRKMKEKAIFFAFFLVCN